MENKSNEIVLHPNLIGNKIISDTWWGQAWCMNVNQYTSDENRLIRGRTYARSGAVKELTVSDSKIKAIVSNNKGQDYTVYFECKLHLSYITKSKIKPLIESPEKLINISNNELLEEYKYLFSSDNYGLFPKKQEIITSCNCLDFHDNRKPCKHILATLYTFGNLLDKNPFLLFEFRGIDTSSVADTILKKEFEKIQSLKESNRKLNGNIANSLFGIDFDNDESSNFDIRDLFDDKESTEEIEILDDETEQKEEKIIENNNPEELESDSSILDSNISNEITINEFELKSTNISDVELENNLEQTKTESELTSTTDINVINNFNRENSSEVTEKNIIEENEYSKKTKNKKITNILKYFFVFTFITVGLSTSFHFFNYMSILLGISLLPIIQDNILKNTIFKILVPIIIFIIMAYSIPQYLSVTSSNDENLKEIISNKELKIYSVYASNILIRDKNYNMVSIKKVETSYIKSLFDDIDYEKKINYDEYVGINYRLIRCKEKSKYIITEINKDIGNKYCE